MNKHIQHLFLFDKFEIQTKLSKQVILKRVKSFADAECTDYYSGVSEDGFFVAEKYIKQFAGGHTQNSFVPIAKAKIVEKDGISTVSVVLRMHILVLILFVPIYVASFLTLVFFPFMLILLHFVFVKPAERLKNFIEDLLIENGIY